MFDFENTPITEYTKLTAKYDCGEGVLSYDGDWARITLIDGTVLEVESEAELDVLLRHTASASVAGQTVPVSEITKLEFGTKVTNLTSNAVPVNVWSSLETIRGFHEGLKTIGDYCLTVNNGRGWGGLFGNTIILPSTITSVGMSLLRAGGDPNLTVIVNCPASVISGAVISGASGNSYFLASFENSDPQYRNGVKIGGKYANEVIANFPNRTTMPYRNLYLAQDNSKETT